MPAVSALRSRSGTWALYAAISRPKTAWWRSGRAGLSNACSAWLALANLGALLAGDSCGLAAGAAGRCELGVEDQQPNRAGGGLVRWFRQGDERELATGGRGSAQVRCGCPDRSATTHRPPSIFKEDQAAVERAATRTPPAVPARAVSRTCRSPCGSRNTVSSTGGKSRPVA